MLVSDGTNTFALCHVQDTPLAFGNPGTEWTGLTGTLTHGNAKFAIGALAFSWPDPRVILIPVTDAEAKSLGSKIYRISPDPYKFQDAVLIGAKDGYYGECRFKIDTSTPDYVKLDSSFLEGVVREVQSVARRRGVQQDGRSCSGGDGEQQLLHDAA